MVLSLVWLRLHSCWLAQNTLWDRVAASYLRRTVNRGLPSTMRTLWVAACLTVCALDLLHSTALRSTHRWLRLVSQLLLGLRLLTHHTLIVVSRILDWAILLLTWILSSIVWLENSGCTWSFLLRPAHCRILWLRLGLNWLCCCYNRWCFFKNQVKVQSCSGLSFLLLDFCIIKFY